MKVLIVKLGAVGDVVKALPMAVAAHALGPEVKVTWICGKTVQSLLVLVPYIDELIVVDEERLLKGNIFHKLRELFRVWMRMGWRTFDLVATAYMDPRYRLLTLMVWGKVRRDLGNLKDRQTPVPGRYQGDEYVRLVTGFEGPGVSRVPIPTLKIGLSEPLQNKLAKEGRPWVALAPGGARNLLRENALRRWPVEYYAQLAAHLAENKVQVLLTGGATDQWVLPYFEKVPVLNLVGETSVPDLVALYGQCDLVVSHDSGPLHLAVLAGVPVIGLFGPTSPDEMVEKNGKVKVFWGGEDLACRPCYNGKEFANCANNLCLKSIDEGSVFEEVQRMLRKPK